MAEIQTKKPRKKALRPFGPQVAAPPDFPLPDTDTSAFDKGVAMADAEGDVKKVVASLAEEAMVKAWFQRLDEARDFDKDAYKQLAIDRSYARGDTLFTTKVNIIGAYIDTWVSLLYARNPDVDCLPAESATESEYADAKLFGKTAQVIVSKQWKKTNLKRQAQPWVRAALTSKIGWLKITWQERKGKDPTTDRAIADLQDNLMLCKERIRALQENKYDTTNEDLQHAELRAAIDGLNAKAEKLVDKGIVVDPVDMADVTISDECPSVFRYLDSPWISHRTYMRVEQAKSTYTDLSEEDWKSASTFSQKRPVASIATQSAILENTTAEMADGYGIAEAVRNSGKGGFVCVEEIQDRITNQIYTLVKGVKRYAMQPYAPYPATSRFYSLFGLTFTEVDGCRWAQSLNERSQTLQDSYSRVVSQLEIHRARSKPKLAFNANAMAETEAKKLTIGETAELIALYLTNPKQDLRQVLTPVSYNQVDMALYDTKPIMSQFELVWGLQEAMTGEIQTAKTATESEFQQAGTQSRTGNKRDILEEALTDIAKYFLEIDVQCLTYEDAVKLAGKEAFWPHGDDGAPALGLDDLDQLAEINIRAGSSGKPNTKAQQESWSATLPILQGLVMQIANLRQSNPIDLANKLEELVEETAARSGDNLDIERFIPAEGQPVQLIDPKTMQPVLAFLAPNQPQQAPVGQPGAAPVPGGPASAQPAPSGTAAVPLADAEGAPHPDAGFPHK